MFRRKRPQPTLTGTGGTHCRLCGTDVELDSLGRCRLGHRVAAPSELRGDTPAGPDAWLADADADDDDVIAETATQTADTDVLDAALPPSTAAVEDIDDDVIDDAREISAVAFPSAVASVPATSFESTSATLVGSGDGAAASTGSVEKHEDDEKPSKRPTSPAPTGADASRERLLEAASWFSISEDS